MKKKLTKKKIAKKKTRKPNLAALNQVVKHAMTVAEESVEAMHIEMRKAQIKCNDYIREEQERCPHMKGGNIMSNAYDPQDASIAWHQLDRGGDTIGICTNCQRKFLPTDADYDFWRKKRTSNQTSRAGVDDGDREVRKDDGGVISKQSGLKLSTSTDRTIVPDPTISKKELDTLDDQEIATLLKKTGNFLKELIPNFKNMSRPERLHILTSLRSFGSLISETKEYHNVLE